MSGCNDLPKATVSNKEFICTIKFNVQMSHLTFQINAAADSEVLGLSLKSARPWVMFLFQSQVSAGVTRVLATLIVFQLDYVNVPWAFGFQETMKGEKRIWTLPANFLVFYSEFKLSSHFLKVFQEIIFYIFNDYYFFPLQLVYSVLSIFYCTVSHFHLEEIT